MLVLKKLVALGAAIAALSVPSLALADNHDHVRVRDDRREDSAMVRLRSDIAREHGAVARDERLHRWEQARHERREMARHERELREMRNRWHR